MSSKTIKNLKEFLEIAEQERFAGMLHYIPYFRGEVSDSFIIQPNLVRGLKDALQASTREKEIIEMVKNKWTNDDDYIQLPNAKGYENEWSLVYQAQHLGVPTRLMDWTLRPEVALFFATWDKSNTHVHDNSRIWILRGINPVEINDDDFAINNSIDSIKESVFTNPPFRIFNENGKLNKAQQNRAWQHGKFLVQSLEESLVPLDQGSLKDNLLKYVIPAEFKPKILDELESIGFTEKTLFA